MQEHGDFVFHLDAPREQFRARRTPLRGWIIAQRELSDLRLCSGQTERRIKLEERPDVRRAFPDHSFVTGFHDEVGPHDLRDGDLHFSFNVGGTRKVAIEHLLPLPPAPSGPARAWMIVRRFLAWQSLRFARSPKARWNAALAALLFDIRLARGPDFYRDQSDRLIALLAEIFPDAFVVQIGANDGSAGDPLAGAFSTTRWSGLLVEPVPHLYEALAARYRDRPGVRVECAAVSTHDGEAPLYRLRTVPGETPQWYDQLPTLNRDVLLKHRSFIPEIDSLVIEERVPAIRLDTLLRRHGISRIDLLVIDTEGHDYEILRGLDFTRFRPALVMFEHQHLSTGDKVAASALLETHGYELRETPEGDTIAWRKL